MTSHTERQSFFEVDVQRIREDVILRQMFIRDSPTNHLCMTFAAWERLTFVDRLAIGVRNDLIYGVYAVDVSTN